jgi:hypothetical protein
MSKAEEFIQENTRNCSQLHYNSACTLRHCITPEQAREAVEIAREEVVDKLRKWIASKNERDSFTFGYIDRHFDELLKQAMKDE